MKLIHRPFPIFEDFTPSMRLVDETLNRLFNEPAASRPWNPAVDIAETDHELLVSADLPGLRMEDIEVRIEDGNLVISGERTFEKKDESAGYHRIERSYGSFKRMFELPDTVEPEKVAATYENGVLKVALPKKETARPRTIKVALGGG